MSLLKGFRKLLSDEFPHVVGIFPIPVLFNKLDLDTVQLVEELRKNYSMVNPNTNGNMTTENIQLLNEPPFADLKEKILLEADKFMREVLNYRFDSVFITTSWANINPPGTNHHTHIHPNSIISGTYYLQTKENCGNLVFSKPQKEIIPALREDVPLDNFSTSSWPVAPFDNLLVMFPSNLTHFVTQNESDENRISLSFNTFVRGEMGDNTALTYLKV